MFYKIVHQLVTISYHQAQSLYQLTQEPGKLNKLLDTYSRTHLAYIKILSKSRESALDTHPHKHNQNNALTENNDSVN
jgi:hypothetical protein